MCGAVLGGHVVLQSAVWGRSSGLALAETSLNISNTPRSLCKAGMQAAGSQ